MVADVKLRMAEMLCEKMVEKYRGEILFGAVFGSVATGKASVHSDIDMHFVTCDSGRAQGKRFLVNGTPIRYWVFRQTEIELALTSPDLHWPMIMASLYQSKILYGSEDLLKGWIKLGESAPDSRFHQALQGTIATALIDSYRKVLSCAEKQHIRDTIQAAVELTYQLNLALCLLNRRSLARSFYSGLEEAFSFPKLPERYAELISRLWLSQDYGEIADLTQILFKNFNHLLATEGIKAKEYSSVASLQV